MLFLCFLKDIFTIQKKIYIWQSPIFTGEKICGKK